MNKVVVVGSSNTDLVVKLSKLPAPGETVLGGDFLEAAGGKGANQAVAAARLGAEVVFVASLGQDPFGDRALENLGSDGIDVRWVRRDPAHASGVALIMVDRQGENMIAVASGANAHLSLEDLEKARPAFENARVVLAQLETPLAVIQRAAELAQEVGAPMILNPAPARPLSDELLGRVEILTPNEVEAEALSGIPIRDQDSACRAAESLQARGVQTVVITMGSKGVWCVSGKERFGVPAIEVQAVDTTAAGDAFSGAMACALAEGRSLRDSVAFANRAAALSVTRTGAQPSLPTREEMRNRFGEN